MMGHRIRSLLALALGAALLSGCTAAGPPEPQEHGVLPFDGETAVDWSALSPAAFAGYEEVHELAVGAGRLWALVVRDAEADDVEPGLFSSLDGAVWEPVDLAALGVPPLFESRPLLAGDGERIAVIFREPLGGDDAPAVLVGERSGDELSWSVTSPADFAPWQLRDQRGLVHIPRHIGGAAWAGDTLVMVAAAQYRLPGAPGTVPTTDESFAVLRLGPDGAQRLADSGEPLGGEALLSTGTALIPVLAEGGTVRFLAGSAHGAGQRHLTEWSSTDAGLSWQARVIETPAGPSGTAWVSVHDAAAGPGGAAMVGSNDGQGVIASTGDGTAWRFHPVPEALWFERVLASESAYYALPFRQAGEQLQRIWHSAGGAEWAPLDGGFGEGTITAAVGLPGGLLVAVDTTLHYTGVLPPLALP